VVAYIIIEYYQIIAKQVKVCLINLNRYKNCHLSEFKFTRDNSKVRHTFLNLIHKLDIDVGQVAIKKSAVKPYLRNNKGTLYNFLIADNIANTILTKYNHVNHINLHLDLNMSKTSRDGFDSYLGRKISYLLFETNADRNVTTKTFHDFSHQEPCIQLADYVSGSLYQLYEREDSRYYEMIKDKILYTNIWGDI
jgi:hypothetical protein